METTLNTKEVRVQLTNELLKKNLETCLKIGNELIEENDLIVQGTMPTGEVDFSDLSKNARKKIAKRMSFLMRNKSRRSLNILLHFLKTRANAFTEKVYVEKSAKETEIDTLRDKYKKLRKETEEARLAFKEAKKGFYV